MFIRETKLFYQAQLMENIVAWLNIGTVDLFWMTMTVNTMTTMLVLLSIDFHDTIQRSDIILVVTEFSVT